MTASFGLAPQKALRRHSSPRGASPFAAITIVGGDRRHHRGARELDSDRALAVEQDAIHQPLSDELEVGAF